MGERWGPRYCKEKLEGQPYCLDVVPDRAHEAKANLSVSERGGKQGKRVRAKTSKIRKVKDDIHLVYVVGKETLDSEIDFCAFCFRSLNKEHYIIVPIEKLKDLKGCNSIRDYTFIFILRKKNGKFKVKDGEVDYSKYLDEKGWKLIKKSLL